jgi:hypothetical protein
MKYRAGWSSSRADSHARKVLRKKTMLRSINTLKNRAIAMLAILAIASVSLLPVQATAQSAGGLISYRKPDGLILSTGNLYFTSHDAATAAVWRASQSAVPGQELLLYSEPYATFGDIVFAQVDGIWWGYFFAQNASGISIKRVPLTGGAASVVANITNVDIANSHRNLLTDGTSLFWQDDTAIRKMPIRGGAIVALDLVSPNTPTAGIAFQNGNIIYASVNDIRYVPTSGAIINPLFRTIVTAASRVASLHTVANGVYWGEQSGAVRVKVGSTITTLSSAAGIPTSISTNGYTAGAAQAWTKCISQSCRLFFDFAGTSSTAIGADAFGATVTSSGSVFWADSAGVHRQF